MNLQSVITAPVGAFGHGLDNRSQQAQPPSAYSLVVPSSSSIRPQSSFTDRLGTNRQSGRDAETLSFTVVGNEQIRSTPFLANRLPSFYVGRHMRRNEGKYPQQLFMNVLALNILLKGRDGSGQCQSFNSKALEEVRKSPNPADVFHAFRCFGFMKHSAPSANVSGPMTAQDATFSLRGDVDIFNLWVGSGEKGVYPSSQMKLPGCKPHSFVGLRLQRIKRGECLAKTRVQEDATPDPRQSKRPRLEVESEIIDAHFDELASMSTEATQPEKAPAEEPNSDGLDPEQSNGDGTERKEGKEPHRDELIHKRSSQKSSQSHSSSSSSPSSSSSSSSSLSTSSSSSASAASASSSGGDYYWFFEPVASFTKEGLLQGDNLATGPVTIPLGMISEWYSGQQEFGQSFLSQVLELPPWYAWEADEKNNASQPSRNLTELRHLPRIRLSFHPISESSRFVIQDENKRNVLVESF